MNIFLSLPATVLALIGPAFAVLPYNPAQAISANNGSLVYLFSPQASSNQASFGLLNTSATLDASSRPKILFPALPFLSDAKRRSFIPLADQAGITVLAGDCQDANKASQLWRFKLDDDLNNGTWTQLQVQQDDTSLHANFLSAGVSFSPTNAAEDASLYVFAGMCPHQDSETAANWVSDAEYSNTMLTLSPESSTANSSPYELSLTGSRAPPIAEAGLTMTPLIPTFSGQSTSQQQNFVLLGGHTQDAFINMSQVALFSLPQASWSFVGVNQPQPGDSTELMTRADTEVEPRSGHTAILAENGSKIIILGGWVGDVSTPAKPQLAVLNVGEGYGGSGDWSWTVPSQSLPAGLTGLYGHGATLLPGGVMLVTGGTKGATSTKARRAESSLYFLNTTSMIWMSSYANLASPSSPVHTAHAADASSSLKSSEKAGLGAGLGIGLAAIAGIVCVWLWYARRLRSRRYMRERELRELALGAERRVEDSFEVVPDHRYPGRRSASWASMQEKRIESSGNPYPWAPVASQGQVHRTRPERDEQESNGARQAERTGLLMEIPSPTRGLRRSLYSRSSSGFGIFPSGPRGPGPVFRIDEEEEGSQGGSLRKTRTAQDKLDRDTVHSDPFKDPAKTSDSAQTDDPGAVQRRKEVQGWVEDWQSAAESLHLSRNPSQAHSRTYSNLSQAYSHSHSNSGTGGASSGRGSPEKSDRTDSNLSERSLYSQASFQKSVAGTVSRNTSQRSSSAGYALFASAAAAMSRLAGSGADYGTSGLARTPSNRSVSHNAISSVTHRPSTRDRAETFSSARSTIRPVRPGEEQVLLPRKGMSRKGQKPPNHYWTPPESPVKDSDAKYSRASSLTRAGVKAMGLMGSVKRVFTGTGGVDVSDRVANFETRGATKAEPEMTEAFPGRLLSPPQPFWQNRKGAKDWNNDEEGESSTAGPALGAVRRTAPAPGEDEQIDDGDDEDWDVESAVQKRVVQVMFTVPKEKLRVVNADAASLLSSNRSDVDHDDDKDREKEVKRMSSVKEGDEDLVNGNENTDKKGKGPLRD